KAVLVTDRLPLVAFSDFEPTRLMLRLPKVARPPASVGWVVVPLSVPVLPPVNVIVTDALGTLLPNTSFGCTTTAGEMLPPATVFVGCCAKVNVSTAAAVMLNALLTTKAAPLDAVRFFEPTRLMLRLPNVAIPLAIVDCVVVPLRVPVPVVNVIVTGALGTLSPKASVACTVTAAAVLTPATVFVGCCTKTSLFAAAGLMLNGVLKTEGVPLAAFRVFEPARLMLRSLKVATPLASVARVVVPLSVPEPVASVITTDAPGTLLANAS